MKGTSWAGSRISRAPLGSRWSCRRSSAGAVSGRSSIFRPAAGCSCSASGRREEKEELKFYSQRKKSWKSCHNTSNSQGLVVKIHTNVQRQ